MTLDCIKKSNRY